MSNTIDQNDYFATLLAMKVTYSCENNTKVMDVEQQDTLQKMHELALQRYVNTVPKKGASTFSLSLLKFTDETGAPLAEQSHYQEVIARTGELMIELHLEYQEETSGCCICC
ncbi:MAG: hypothetical protein S4CHLAM81_04830 [Chlamydiales bacterium]|nr:hypothetical protein [Chlamydiales bacterium]MCH9635272.1 hypothetical protein [Chlamydiales bacterium]MCH9704097.1 hypothetical protein [Chlamydiota bacterium]